MKIFQSRKTAAAASPSSSSSSSSTFFTVGAAAAAASPPPSPLEEIFVNLHSFNLYYVSRPMDTSSFISSSSSSSSHSSSPTSPSSPNRLSTSSFSSHLPSSLSCPSLSSRPPSYHDSDLEPEGGESPSSSPNATFKKLTFPASQGISMVGELTVAEKKGKEKKRVWALREDELGFYKQERWPARAGRTSFHPVLKLSEVQEVFHNSLCHSLGEGCFMLRMEAGETLTLKAETRAEMLDWIYALASQS